MEFLKNLAGSEFLPHGHCFFWRPDILWLNVGSDALIALAYYSIPLGLVYIVRHGQAGFGWIFWMFSAFIFLCGTTHVVEIWTVWNGSYGVEGMVKLLTAAVSIATAVALWRMIPKAIALPSPARLGAANLALRHEIGQRERVASELRNMQSALESRVGERTAALEGANRALTREIAERERAEERFRQVVEASPAGIVMVDAGGTIVLVNQATEQIFGYTRQELIGAPIELLIPERFRDEHPLHRGRFLAKPSSRAMGAGRNLYGLRRDRSEVPVEIGLNPIQTGEGLFVLSYVVDITEREHSERMLRTKTEQLERSNRELDEFAQIVSHDLKAPLRGIISLSSWVVEDCAHLLPEESQEHLALIPQRAQRLGRLIDGILHYSRIGRSESPLERIDTGQAIREVVDSLPSSEAIRVRVEDPLPLVLYDRTQLLQVFQNLIGNALEHLGKPAGEIVVSCREDREAFEFAVRDDGIGIDERHFERIFRMFQALDANASNAGIGLALVKKIVEKHGGHVSVESKLGLGSTFRFTIPKEPAVARDAGREGARTCGE